MKNIKINIKNYSNFIFYNIVNTLLIIYNFVFKALQLIMIRIYNIWIIIILHLVI